MRTTALTSLLLLAVLATGCQHNKGLVRAQDGAKPTTRATTYGSPGLLATAPAGPQATKQVTATAPARRTAASVVVASSRPTGRVLIAHFERLPQAQQTHFACDRLLVDLHNASSAAVASVSVGFVTYWFPDSTSGADTQSGRNVTMTRTVSLPAGAQKRFAYDVCLPEHKSRNVFAEPVSTSWVWARS